MSGAEASDIFIFTNDLLNLCLQFDCFICFIHPLLIDKFRYYTPGDLIFSPNFSDYISVSFTCYCHFPIIPLF